VNLMGTSHFQKRTWERGSCLATAFTNALVHWLVEILLPTVIWSMRDS